VELAWEGQHGLEEVLEDQRDQDLGQTKAEGLGDQDQVHDYADEVECKCYARIRWMERVETRSETSELY
jgi:hypothetical protein